MIFQRGVYIYNPYYYSIAIRKNVKPKIWLPSLHHYFHLIDRVLIETPEKQKNCVNWVWWFQQHFFPTFFSQWCSESIQ